MRNWINSKLFFILTPLLTFSFGLYLLFNSPEQPKTAIKEKAWLVQAITLNQGKHTPTKILYGQVVTTHKAKLASSISSDVIAVNIKEGQSVKKESELIKLNTDNYQFLTDEKKAEIQSLEAQRKMELTTQQMNQQSLLHDEKLLTLNKKNRERLEALSKRKHSSRSEVDNADKLILQQMLLVKKRELEIANHENKIAEINAKIAKATAQYQQAKNDLEDTVIKAPFDGLISTVNVAIGTQVYPQTPLLAMYDLNEVYVQAQISHKLQPQLIHAITTKQTVIASPANFPTINLKLDRLASEVEENNANVKAFFKVPIAYARTTPLGISVSLLLKLPQIQAYKIPISSMYGNNNIYIIENSRLKQVNVQRLGSILQNGRFYLLIASDELKDGDKLMITKLPEARTGIKVKLYKE